MHFLLQLKLKLIATITNRVMIHNALTEHSHNYFDFMFVFRTQLNPNHACTPIIPIC